MNEKTTSDLIVEAVVTIAVVYVASKVAGKLSYKAMNWNHKRKTGMTLEEKWNSDQTETTKS